MIAIVSAVVDAIIGAFLSMWISHRMWKLDALKAAAKNELDVLQDLKKALRRLWKSSFGNKSRQDFDAVDILASELSSAVLRESVMIGAEAQFHVDISDEEEVSKFFQKARDDIKFYEKSIHEMFSGKSWMNRIKDIENELQKNQETGKLEKGGDILNI